MEKSISRVKKTTESTTRSNAIGSSNGTYRFAVYVVILTSTVIPVVVMISASQFFSCNGSAKGLFGVKLEDVTMKDPVKAKGIITPWEACMQQVDQDYKQQMLQEDRPLFLHGAVPVKDQNMTLTEAFMAENTAIYFLHQRKAGGTSVRKVLFDYFVKLVGEETAKKRSFVPCFGGVGCVNFELPLYEQNYLGRIKLVGSHMSYHTPFARSLYENQVLITNFREPLSRIKSCMLYRYFDAAVSVFSSPSFTLEKGEELLMKTKDQYDSTCIQEPFRILSPFDPDKEPVSKRYINEVCCYVKSMFHVVRPPPVLNRLGQTVIEKELTNLTTGYVLNDNSAKMAQLSPRGKKNLDTFLEYIGKENAFVQSEIDLYKCLFGPQ